MYLDSGSDFLPALVKSGKFWFHKLVMTITAVHQVYGHISGNINLRGQLSML